MPPIDRNFLLNLISAAAVRVYLKSAMPSAGLDQKHCGDGEVDGRGEREEGKDCSVAGRARPPNIPQPAELGEPRHHVRVVRVKRQVP